MERMQICYLFKKSHGYSIEKYFGMIKPYVEKEYKVGCEQVPFLSGKISNIIKNIRYTSRIDADLIHITGDIHYTAIGQKNKKIILTIMDLDNILNMRGIKGIICRYLWGTIPCKYADVITTISERSKSQIVSCYPPAENKIHIIGAPISDDLFLFEKPYVERNIPNILVIGSGQRENKNHKNMIMALKGIPCHLRIVGREYDKEKEWLNENNIDYSYRTDLSEEELREEYSNSNIVLFASKSEGFGMIIIEAQALGRPVITSNIEPMRSIAGEAACLVDPNDIDSIRNGVLEVLKNDQYRKQMISAGRNNAKRFTAANLAKEHMELYKMLLEK